MAQPSSERWAEDMSMQQPYYADPSRPRGSAWTGWLAFAGVMMILLGAFNIIDGLVAVFKDDFYAVGRSGLVINVDFTAWGWVMLIGGVVVLLAGFGVLAGKLWARIIGVIVAGLNAIVQLGFISAFPVWGIIIITVDVLVIWALTAHGREMAA
jgi:hypothetical protein